MHFADLSQHIENMQANLEGSVQFRSSLDQRVTRSDSARPANSAVADFTASTIPVRISRPRHLEMVARKLSSWLWPLRPRSAAADRV
jgi:hypothetical protein